MNDKEFDGRILKIERAKREGPREMNYGRNKISSS